MFNYKHRHLKNKEDKAETGPPNTPSAPSFSPDPFRFFTLSGVEITVRKSRIGPQTSAFVSPSERFKKDFFDPKMEKEILRASLNRAV